MRAASLPPRSGPAAADSSSTTGRGTRRRRPPGEATPSVPAGEVPGLRAPAAMPAAGDGHVGRRWDRLGPRFRQPRSRRGPTVARPTAAPSAPAARATVSRHTSDAEGLALGSRPEGSGAPPGHAAPLHGRRPLVRRAGGFDAARPANRARSGPTGPSADAAAGAPLGRGRRPGGTPVREAGRPARPGPRQAGGGWASWSARSPSGDRADGPVWSGGSVRGGRGRRRGGRPVAGRCGSTRRADPGRAAGAPSPAGARRRRAGRRPGSGRPGGGRPIAGAVGRATRAGGGPGGAGRRAGRAGWRPAAGARPGGADLAGAAAAGRRARLVPASRLAGACRGGPATVLRPPRPRARRPARGAVPSRVGRVCPRRRPAAGDGAASGVPLAPVALRRLRRRAPVQAGRRGPGRPFRPASRWPCRRSTRPLASVALPLGAFFRRGG